VLIYFTVDYPVYGTPYTTVAFFIGAFTSMLCGYIGMRIAVETNVKTAWACNDSINEGFHVAFKGGQVLGFALVGLALAVLQVIIIVYTGMIKQESYSSEEEVSTQFRHMFELIAGYGLGGSTVALFGRVGGGIYTKAADVGADLAGKVCEGLEEDSPDNPGTIADNVGDNVGDIAGMGADLFGSLAESTCAALVVSAHGLNILQTPDAAYFPLIVTAVGILASFVTVFFIGCAPVSRENVESKLKWQLIMSTVLMTVLVIPTLQFLPDSATFKLAGRVYEVTKWHSFASVISGLWSGLIIGFVTEYFTSNQYSPVINLAESCRMGAAPNIILGLALGYQSTIIPIICLAVTIWVSFTYAGLYGVALAAIGMLGCLPIALTIDGYGPIADNAGGITEMSSLHENVRKNTDKLDAAGNTTAAIGKGFAIGSACLVALALFGAYISRIEGVIDQEQGTFVVNVMEPTTFAGLLIGAMIPYAFSALTMSAVGDAANEMIKEIQA
jgi:inorganic pyrophosphatase